MVAVAITSSTPRAFVRARIAIAAAAASILVAMLCYPGGTALDRSTSGFQVTGNFMSDLGMTVAYDGRTNYLGAACFVAGMLALIVGIGGLLPTLIARYSTTTAARWLVRGAAVAGLGVCLLFAGVAFTPENRVMDLHVWFTVGAFRLFPVVTALLAAAAYQSAGVSRRAGALWIVLTLCLAAYVVNLGWGPSTGTAAGLAWHVIAQKLIATAVLAVLLVQTWAHDNFVRQ